MIFVFLLAFVFLQKTAATDCEVLSSASLLPSKATARAEIVAENIGVLLLNLGGPDERPNSVEGFLYNLFADPDIIRLPKCLNSLQKPLAYMISKFRTKKSTANYAMITEQDAESNSTLAISPINKITKLQASLLEQKLRLLDRNEIGGGNSSISCYYAMRYWHPFTSEVFEKMKLDGVTKLIILPLYPQYSISTTRSSLKSVENVMNYDDLNYWGNVLRVSHTVIPFWHYREGYVKLLSQMLHNDTLSIIEDRLNQHVVHVPHSDNTNFVYRNNADIKESQQIIHVLFSAHGVPVSYVELYGDPYQSHIEESVLWTIEHLCNHVDVANANSVAIHCDKRDYSSIESVYKHDDASYRVDIADNAYELHFHLSYQSKVGPVEWLKPYTDDTIIEIGEKGGVNLIVVPIAFVSDHIETLQEIDIEYRELAIQHGIRYWKRGTVANTHPDFISEMADMVMESLSSSKQKPADTIVNVNKQHTSRLITVSQAAHKILLRKIPDPIVLAFENLNQDPEAKSMSSSLSQTITSSVGNFFRKTSNFAEVFRTVRRSGVVEFAAHTTALGGASYLISALFNINIEYVVSAVIGIVLSIFLQK